MIFLASLLLSLCRLPMAVWGGFALGHRLPMPQAPRMLAALLWMLFHGVLLERLWGGYWFAALLLWLPAVLVLMLWWRSIRPLGNLDWADELQHISTGEIDGDRLQIHNLRNFDWRTEQDYEVRWESREYDLSQLVGVDMLLSRWGRPGIAHVLVSFGFTDGRHLAFTVEVRRQRGEKFSEIGGFFKQFELCILACDERDAVRLRTNVRGEDVSLYRVRLKPPACRQLLMAFIEAGNQLDRQPRFYNTVTANCTTLVFNMMRRIFPRLPLDFRLLLTGHLPSYVESVGGLIPGYSLDSLNRLGQITARAHKADRDPQFSRYIREGVPGWD